jgi:hypothetical protein
MKPTLRNKTNLLSYKKNKDGNEQTMPQSDGT